MERLLYTLQRMTESYLPFAVTAMFGFYGLMMAYNFKMIALWAAVIMLHLVLFMAYRLMASLWKRMSEAFNIHYVIRHGPQADTPKAWCYHDTARGCELPAYGVLAAVMMNMTFFMAFVVAATVLVSLASIFALYGCLLYCKAERRKYRNVAICHPSHNAHAVSVSELKLAPLDWLAIISPRPVGLSAKERAEITARLKLR